MPYSFIDIEAKLKKNWFIVARQKWSHVIFVKDKIRIVVPKHWNKDISIWVEKSILKLLWISKELFKEM